MSSKTPPAKDRLARYRRGKSAEWLAAGFLILKRHRILARRFKAASGEIDLIAVRGGRIAFVEVKRRNSRAECEASITPRLRQRVRRAADIWLAQHPHYQNHDLGFDLIFICPLSLPLHLRDAL